jgi:hypothetical protein
MERELRAALAAAKLYTDGRTYSLVGLPCEVLPRIGELLNSPPSPFWTIMADKDELSLLIPSDTWAMHAERLTLGRVLPRVVTGYRLITLDVVLPPSLVGFLAHITPPLADAGIPILAFSAYTCDHLLVPKDRFEAAWSVLERLIQAAAAEVV